MKAGPIFSLSILLGLTAPCIARLQVTGGRVVSDRTNPASLGLIEDEFVPRFSGRRHAPETRKNEDSRRTMGLDGDVKVQRYVALGISNETFSQVP